MRPNEPEESKYDSFLGIMSCSRSSAFSAVRPVSNGKQSDEAKRKYMISLFLQLGLTRALTQLYKLDSESGSEEVKRNERQC